MNQPFHDIALQYDLLNDLLSLGLHRRWKRKLAAEILELEPSPKAVLDIATGTGDMAALFGEKLPVDKVTPMDPSPAMMDQGKKKYPFLKKWTHASAEDIPFTQDSFSIATCTFGIRNFQNRAKAFNEISRVLGTGGIFGVLEIHPIPKSLVYLPFRIFWQLIVPTLGALFRKKEAYKYLRDTGAQFISAEDMVKELEPYFNLKKKQSLLGGGLVSFFIFEKK